LVLAAFLAGLAVVVGVVNPSFGAASNLTDVASNASYCLVAAAAMTAVIIGGNVDISIGSILGLSAALAGSLAVRGWSLGPLLAVTIAAGAAFGACNAAAVVGLRLPAIIVTLGTLNIFRGVLLVATGGRWITGLPPGFRALALGKVGGVPVGVLVSVGVAALIWAGLRFTRWGRCVYLVGDNSRAASRLGVPVRWITASVLILMGAASALAAAMFAARFSAVQSNAGLGFEMLVITCVVVGGTAIFGGSGTILGTVLGVLLVAVIGNALTLLHLSEYWEKAAQGSLVLAAVAADVVRRRRAAG
jgi:ribose/xylose/arabinose/galactoside ABC-type transport system permease subunit